MRLFLWQLAHQTGLCSFDSAPQLRPRPGSSSAASSFTGKQPRPPPAPASASLPAAQRPAGQAALSSTPSSGRHLASPRHSAHRQRSEGTPQSCHSSPGDSRARGRQAGDPGAHPERRRGELRPQQGSPPSTPCLADSPRDPTGLPSKSQSQLSPCSQQGCLAPPRSAEERCAGADRRQQLRERPVTAPSSPAGSSRSLTRLGVVWGCWLPPRRTAQLCLLCHRAGEDRVGNRLPARSAPPSPVPPRHHHGSGRSRSPAGAEGVCYSPRFRWSSGQLGGDLQPAGRAPAP